MRLIPGKTKVKIELFKNITIPDVAVAMVGLSLVTLCTVTSFKFRWIIAIVVATIFGFLLFRLDDDPMYIFIWHMLRYKAYPRRFQRIYTDEAIIRNATGDRQDTLDAFYNDELPGETEPLETTESVDTAEPGEPEEDEEVKLEAKASEIEDAKAEAREKKRQLKELLKEENKILKSKTATKEEKDAVWLARAERSAAKKKEKAGNTEADASFKDVSEIMPFTGIAENFIEYNGEYFGAVIEIDPVEFRFFSQHRRDKSIEDCFGQILRGLTGEYGANIVKIQRPIVYDDYLEAEYDKLDALKKSYESGMLSEAELQARVEIQYDRINEVRRLCFEEKVIDGFYYLVLFENDRDRLNLYTRQAISLLEQGELTVRRLDNRGLALFLKYSNSLDFDEKEIDSIPEEQYANWAMPENLKFSMRKIEVNGIITHNMRVISFPTVVGDSWLAGVMSFPGTKVVVKATPMDREKAIRAIDRSLAELRGQYMSTSVDSKIIELQGHIDTLSTLLVTLQQDNEALMSVNIYVTAYDASATANDPLLSENFETLMPYIADMKKTVKRSWSEAGMKLAGMDFLQLQSFIGSQVSAYDPLQKEARGIPSNTIAGMFPWIFAHISDVGGIQLGRSDGIPVFIDFFRRDEERVNSNMVIVGKSGSGKSYATKSLLTNLSSEDAKIFILDPENEYSELAHTLHGKIINVGNAKYGRLNPFHIITALDDDEAGEEGGGPGGSFATHLQFLEEFFKQILPDIDRDSLEYLNSLVERMYLNFGITPDTDLSKFKAGDYPIFDDLYDVILAEFERTNNEYLRQLLRSLVNYISKFATGGRNANIWNGPSTITTDENFSVFNFQSMLANRNNTIANAQMLLVLKYIDNEIIKNRDYNIKYGLKRKIVVVIDEAHVFIDTKFPVALDFMFQLAKRIRKYNGMQIVITQNIKDFVGSEEIARKSSAIINACQYSFVFGLAPNDMDDLCKLYAKAGGINETEQEDIIGAKRGQAFTIMSPTSRSSFAIEVPDSFVDMFESQNFESNYFYGTEGAEVWEDFVKDSREEHDINLEDRKRLEAEEGSVREVKSNFTFSEISEDEAEDIAAAQEAEETLAEHKEERQSAVDKMIAAEEAVNRKEYEMSMGRFGGINLQEVDSLDDITVSEDEYEDNYSEDTAEEYTADTTEEYTDNYSDEYSDVNTEDYSDDAEEPVTAPVSPAVARARATGENIYTQAELDEKLTQFRDVMMAEMSKELEEKIKWIALGANAAQGDTSMTGAAVAGMTAAAMPKTTSYEPEEEVTGYEPAAETPSYRAETTEDDYFTAEEKEAEERFEEDQDRSYLDDIGEGYEEPEDTDDLFGFGEEDEELDFSAGLEDEEEDEDFGDSLFDTVLFGDDDEEESSDELGETSDDESYDEDEDSYEDEEDEFDSLFDDDDDDDYEPAPFLFAELLAEAAEEYADMGIDERMEESGEEVMDVTLEELAEYIKKARKEAR